MSMDTLIVLQFVMILTLYCIMTLMLPAILLYKKISHWKFTTRFMAYQVFGNTFLIDLVLLLQLLHISDRFTLVLFTFLPYFAAYAVLYQTRPKQQMQDVLEQAQRIASGKYGARLFLRRVRKRVMAAVGRSLAVAGKRLYRNLVDVLLVAAVAAAIFYTYGPNLFRNYSYCASDIVVHNYWINRMGQGQLYVAGIYPFGLHCIIYYLHTVFGVETYVLLRLFWLVETLLIHYMLLAFIRTCCKAKYTAYVGLFLYTMVKLFTSNTYTRFFSSLPQEFGMAFILPAIAFLFLFFEHKKQEMLDADGGGKRRKSDKEEKEKWEERIYLLDDVLAESEARKAAAAQGDIGQASMALQEEARDAEAIWILEEDPRDGTFVIKETLLGGDNRPEDAMDSSTGDVSEDAAEGTLHNTIEGAGNGPADQKTTGKKHRWRRKAADEPSIQAPQRGWRAKARAGLGREFAQDSSWYLAGFTFSLSLTLAIHFYNTIIAAIFCLGVGIGYAFRLIRWRYLWRVMLAGILSIFLAVLPMFLAFLGGTPLEGSLYWAMSVIKGTEDQQAEPEEDEDEDENSIYANFTVISGSEIIVEGKVVSKKGSIEGGTVLSKGDISIGNKTIPGGQMVSDGKILDDGEVFYEGLFISVGNDLPEPEGSSGTAEDGTGSQGAEEDTDPDDPEASVSWSGEETGVRWLVKWIYAKMVRIQRLSKITLETYLLEEEYEGLGQMVPVSSVLLMLMAVLYFLLRQPDYAGRMMSVAFYIAFMSIVMVAPGLGLPELMDANRASIYYAYSLIAVWCLCMDGVLQFLFGWWERKILLHLASFVLVLAVTAATLKTDMIKETEYAKGSQSNAAVVALTNIIKDGPDHTWTIVSANDELRMGEDYGYHYQLDTFLRKMEKHGGASTMILPTKKVYFFIDKKVTVFATQEERVVEGISRVSAANPLPPNNGIHMYEGGDRLIEMSRLYYWAQRFKELYPNEITVYYETEDFVCYCVEQNEYSLYNFSINYLYNNMSYAED